MAGRKRRRSFEEQQRVDQQRWYDDMHTRQVKLKLNTRTDADVLEWIDSRLFSRGDTVQGAIKRLIRRDIRRAGRKGMEGGT